MSKQQETRKPLRKIDTKTIVGIGLLSAIIVVLHYAFGGVQIAGASINAVLVPVVIGAALYGWQAGAFLGLVSGIVILASGVADGFVGWHPFGTYFTVLLKGTASGLTAGLIYRWLEKYNKTLAVILAACLCPVVNTSIFVAGCYVFFLPEISPLAAGKSVFGFIMMYYVGINFIVELGVNILLAPTITRLIRIGKKQ